MSPFPFRWPLKFDDAEKLDVEGESEAADNANLDGFQPDGAQFDQAPIVEAEKTGDRAKQDKGNEQV